MGWYRGTLLIRKRTPQDPTAGPCLGPYGGPKGVGVVLCARHPCTSDPRSAKSGCWGTSLMIWHLEISKAPKLFLLSANSVHLKEFVVQMNRVDSKKVEVSTFLECQLTRGVLYLQSSRRDERMLGPVSAIVRSRPARAADPSPPR